MQTRGVLLLFCTSTCWVFTETFPTTTVENKPKNLIKEILYLINNSIFTHKQGPPVTLPVKKFKQECSQRNLEIFIDATKKITAATKENYEGIEGILGNLKDLQKFTLPECTSQGCDCQNAILPFKDFKDRLESFLEVIDGYFSEDTSS